MSRLSYILLTLVVLIGSYQLSHGQKRFQYTQFQQTAIIYNPAFSGIEDFVDIKIGYRNRWAGSDPNPQSAFALGSVALKITTGNRYKRQGIRLVEPEAYHNLETPTEFQYRKGRRHGLGAAVLTDQNDAFSSVGGMFTYAYHLPISDFLIWNMGTSVSVFSERLDPSNLTVLEPDLDPTYQFYAQGTQNNTNAYLNFGTVLYSFKFYLGYSANNLLRATISEGYQQTENRIVHNVMAGWLTFPRYGYVVIPSIMAEIVSQGKTDVIVALKGKFEDKFWGGLSYRLSDAVGANVGFYLTGNLALSYNFEYSLSALSEANFGSHELILALKLNNRNFSRAFLW